jgi:Fic family protein
MNKIADPLAIARLVDHNQQGVSRLIGAYRQVGRGDFADAILKQLSDLGYLIREIDKPFDQPLVVPLTDVRNPMYNRIKLLFELFREDVLAAKPDIPLLSLSETEYLASIEAIKVDDAYHSLSIERYRVTPDLIQKIAVGDWNPQSEQDKQQRDAMAAKGYLEAFNLVKLAANQAYLKQKTGAELFIEQHQRWFAQLFMPSVEAGLLKRQDLIGYRRHLVFLSGSKHIPPHFEHILDGLDALKQCLLAEPDAFVKAVMVHFLLGYIHPFMDGNGRTARFAMNVMLAEGHYPWTIIPVSSRAPYMQALEKASVEKNIKPFAQFISDAIKAVFDKGLN